LWGWGVGAVGGVGEVDGQKQLQVVSRQLPVKAAKKSQTSHPNNPKAGLLGTPESNTAMSGAAAATSYQLSGKPTHGLLRQNQAPQSHGAPDTTFRVQWSGQESHRKKPQSNCAISGTRGSRWRFCLG